MQIEACPWDTGAIRYSFVICEEALCQWVRQPANSWSNLGMLVIGIVLITRGLRKPSDSDFYSGICIALMGLCSFGAHATGMFLFGFLDVASIYIYMSLLAVFSLKRINRLDGKQFYIFWATISLVFILSQVFLPQLQFLLLIPFGLYLILSESRFLIKNKKTTQPRPLYFALGALFLAAICLAFDFAKVFCQPNNHFFQLHAGWHLLAAIGMYFIANYLRQFHLKIR